MYGLTVTIMLFLGMLFAGANTSDSATSDTTMSAQYIQLAQDDGQTFIPGACPVSSAVPEPASMLLVGSALLGLAALRKKK